MAECLDKLVVLVGCGRCLSQGRVFGPAYHPRSVIEW